MDSETFAERISRLTGAARMTDADLASVLGVSENQAKRIKSGTTSTLKLDGALRLARRLGVTPHYLAGEPEPRSPSRGEQTFEGATAIPATLSVRNRPQAMEWARDQIESIARDVAAALEEKLQAIAAAADASTPEQNRIALAERLRLLREQRGFTISEAATACRIASDEWEVAERGDGMARLSVGLVGSRLQVSVPYLLGFTESDEPLAGTTAVYSGLASIAESVTSTPPAASDGSQLRSNSIFYRLESLEADAVDNLRIANKTRALDAALRALLDFEVLPEILRDRLREALETDESGQS